MKHLIKIEPVAHGVLGMRHAGRDQQYCEAGELVIIEWQPDAGWGLQEAHYTDKDGNVTEIEFGNFVMPDKEITIGGTFKRFVLDDWTGDVVAENVTAEGDVSTGRDVKVGRNVEVAGNVTAVGDVTANNVSAKGDVTAGGDVSAGNVSAGNVMTKNLILTDESTGKQCRVFVDNEVLKVETLS